MGRSIISLAGLILFSTLLGCATVQPAKTPMEMASEPEARLTLGPGDVLDIKFYYAPELNESQTVRPDGKITLQLIGEVAVKGKAPAELQEELVRAYTGAIKEAGNRRHRPESQRPEGIRRRGSQNPGPYPHAWAAHGAGSHPAGRRF